MVAIIIIIFLHFTQVTPLFDRHKPVPEEKLQIGFISAIVLPLFEAFSRVPNISLSHCVEQAWNDLQTMRNTLNPSPRII